MKTKITWVSPSGEKIDVCRHCSSFVTDWPRDSKGREFCTVSEGLHTSDSPCEICKK